MDVVFTWDLPAITQGQKIVKSYDLIAKLLSFLATNLSRHILRYDNKAIKL